VLSRGDFSMLKRT